MPPVQNIAIFLFLFISKFFLTYFLNSEKFLVFGLIDPLKVPSLTSKSFLTSITIVCFSLISLFHSTDSTCVDLQYFQHLNFFH